MALKTTPVPRNLGTRVRFLGLEVEDLIAILIIAALANISVGSRSASSSESRLISFCSTLFRCSPYRG